MNVTITGGGTGGHLFPAIAVAQELQRRDRSNAIQFIGSARGIEAQLLPKAGYLLQTVNIKGFAGKPFLKKIESLLSILPAILNARRLLLSFRSEIVIGFGGYISFPAVIAGRMLGLPVALHEQNSVPGLSNRLLSFWAKRVFVTYAESMCCFSAPKTIHSGLPLRTVPDVDRANDHGSNLFTVCVMGGSQGASEINNAIVGALPVFEQSGMRVRFIHQTGTQDFESVKEAYQRYSLQAEVAPFFDDMLSRFIDANLVIARAGAGTLAELAVCGRASILIPYSFAAGDHQKKNALVFTRQGAAQLLESHELNSTALAQKVIDLMCAPERLHSMAQQARLLAQPQAAQIIVDECCRLVAA